MSDDRILDLYMQDVRRSPLLTHEDEIRLATAAQAGCMESRNKMVLGNLRLVISQARRFAGRGLRLLDLINEGNTGLMHAVGKYDTTSGFKFSTYAVQWIQERMRRAIVRQAHDVRVAEQAHGNVVRLRRTMGTMMTINGGAWPSDKELADATQMPVKKVRELLQVAMGRAEAPVPRDEDDDYDPLDVLVDDSALNPDGECERAIVNSTMQSLLGRLTPRERQVIAMRFGLDGLEEHTLEEVGDAIGKTRERVRQIQIAAMAKMRRWAQQPKLVRAHG